MLCWVALFISASTGTAAAAPLFVDWTSPTAGTLGGVNVTLTGAHGAVLDASDLSTPDYAAAPGSANQESIDYSVFSGWTITFDAPVENLRLYADVWRGGGVSGVDDVEYTFDHAFTILSGLAGSSTSGNTLKLPAVEFAFFDGILEFAGPITSLTVSTNLQNNAQSAILMTFGIDDAAGPAPEPSPAPLPAAAWMGTAAAGLIASRRRRA
jgi:hypothetical protein